jgi:hypothetical protein
VRERTPAVSAIHARDPKIHWTKSGNGGNNYLVGKAGIQNAYYSGFSMDGISQKRIPIWKRITADTFLLVSITVTMLRLTGLQSS